MKSPVADLHIYDYRDTRLLVSLTGRAAALIEEKGEKAFESFRKHPKRWSLDGSSYLYVYDMDGVNLFHGGYPELKGKDLSELTDLHGKKPVNIIIDQLDKSREYQSSLLDSLSLGSAGCHQPGLEIILQL